MDTNVNVSDIQATATYLHQTALDAGWSVTPVNLGPLIASFTARNIPRGVEVQTEVSREGLRSWRLEHRTQTKVVDQVVTWFWEFLNVGTVPAVQPVAAVVENEVQVREQANVIAAQASAIAEGRVVGPRFAAVRRLQDNVAMLAAWVGDDRS
ncbi:hypothetical protein [Mycolicibacterium sphagni]|uniref:hypothetical protein n=1 Tax=Mycolicibacterium sphagni TaxID=1786 RepID=UPI0021F2CD0E|nr:hypothetical protein [Mycolicibacterium sphagni]MCV7174853.1 hypothetical protein [Mycolicibacterium sphagni]